MNLRCTSWVFLACLLMAGCGAQPKDLILGKWQAVDGRGDTVEFFKDGTVTFVVDGIKIGGHFTFAKETVIEISWDSPVRQSSGFQAEKSLQFPKVTKEQLMISDPNGQTKTYKRAA